MNGNSTDAGNKPAAITVARGDGIGPEIMESTLAVLDAAGANLDITEIEIGESMFHKGHSAGIAPESWDILRENKVFLKAPITTPQGGGFKSLNVTIRKGLGLYSNVRPCVAYHPFVTTRHPDMDVVIIRENEEDLYAGIEHRQTDDVYQCLKLISRPGCERIVRYAFEYARTNHRKKVTAFVKDNIMKLTDGIFHKVFDEVAADYPDIEADHLIVDIGAARIADTPEMFDVIVTLNLYGDIISDIAAQITGSVGLAGSANIGDQSAMFEAIHGSAPPIAGKGIANPSGLLLASVMMLTHVGQPKVAETIHNGWLSAIEQGFHTGDIFDRKHSKQRCTTKEFTEAVIELLGSRPDQLPPVSYSPKNTDRNQSGVRMTVPQRSVKTLVGVDVFLDHPDISPDDLAAKLMPVVGNALNLQVISNRGTKVWPDGLPETFCADHWRCRFIAKESSAVKHTDVISLLGRLNEAGLDFIKTEHLYDFDGKPGYSAAQGT
ncbi:MAG: NADP-dependent isocitrate dehydrogenase [Alphaproteobacteria bacterium]|nr:NADP-dependent isocitrate dehydrogenase [Alphaproteobacteria bacterium SS10]